MSEELLKLLNEELEKAGKAKDRLKISYEKCKIIGEKTDYNEDELESFETLTSRFARFSDILIKKIFHLLERMDLDDVRTIRDSIILAEKKGLITSYEKFLKIRELRNFTAHEYEDEELLSAFSEILTLTPLFDSLERTKNYILKY